MERAGSEAPLAYRAVRGGLWVALSAYWTLAFGFAANILLTRMLPPEAFGTFALATFFAQLLRVQTKLGLGYAFGQYRETSGASIGTYAALEAVAAFSGLVLMGLASPLLRVLGYEDSVILAALVLSVAALLEGISSIAGTLLEKGFRFERTSLYQSIVFPLSYLPAFWLAAHGGGVWSLVAQTLTYSLLGLGLWGIARREMAHLWKAPWGFRPDLARYFLRFGAATGLWLMAGMLFSQLDNFLIGTFAGVTVLGYYDRAYRMAQWPGLLFNAVLTRTAFYTYARVRDARARLEKVATIVTWTISITAIPLALAVFIAAPELIELLYGKRWLPSVLFLRILIAFFVIRPHLENAGVLLNAVGRPGQAAKVLWIQVAILGMAGLPLTWRWGALGTCGALGLALGIGALVSYFYVRGEIDGRVGFSFGVPLLAGAMSWLGFMLVRPFVPPGDLTLAVRLILKIAYTFLSFYAIILALQLQAIKSHAGWIQKLVRGGWKEDHDGSPSTNRL